jgi:hypothetical protein
MITTNPRIIAGELAATVIENSHLIGEASLPERTITFEENHHAPDLGSRN